MQKFITKALINTGLITAIVISFNVFVHLTSPVKLKTESKFYIAKYDFFKKHKDEFDTVFIGSSRFYRHLDPELFDQLTAKHTFNFGVPSCFPPRSNSVFDEIIKLKPAKLENIIFELSSPETIEKNYKSEREFFNIDPFFELNTHFFIKDKFDIGEFYNSIRAIFFKYTRALKIIFYPLQKIESYYIGSNGFLPLDLEVSTTPDPSTTKDIIRRNQEFNKTHNINSYDYDSKDKNYSRNLIDDYFDRLIKTCKNKNIKLYFVVTPRSNPNEIIPLYKNIVKKHGLEILDFSSAKKYPELFNIENSFDKGHLNSQGARIFTRKIAAAIKPL